MTNKSTIISAVAGSVATCVVFVSIGIFLLLRWKKSQKSVQDKTDPFDSEKPCELYPIKDKSVSLMCKF